MYVERITSPVEVSDSRTRPMVAVYRVYEPVRRTQCAAVSTTRGATTAPPQPIDSRTIHGNSPSAASVPPTTDGVTPPAGDACAAGCPSSPSASVTRTPSSTEIHFRPVVIPFLLRTARSGNSPARTLAPIGRSTSGPYG